MTPAISLFVECSDEDELESLFAAFMPLDDYGFSRRYGWVQDRFGVPWQLNLRYPVPPGWVRDAIRA